MHKKRHNCEEIIRPEKEFYRANIHAACRPIKIRLKTKDIMGRDCRACMDDKKYHQVNAANNLRSGPEGLVFPFGFQAFQTRDNLR